MDWKEYDYVTIKAPEMTEEEVFTQILKKYVLEDDDFSLENEKKDYF